MATLLVEQIVTTIPLDGSALLYNPDKFIKKFVLQKD
jgi:hypothetical protein